MALNLVAEEEGRRNGAAVYICNSKEPVSRRSSLEGQDLRPSDRDESMFRCFRPSCLWWPSSIQHSVAKFNAPSSADLNSLRAITDKRFRLPSPVARRH